MTVLKQLIDNKVTIDTVLIQNALEACFNLVKLHPEECHSEEK